MDNKCEKSEKNVNSAGRNKAAQNSNSSPSDGSCDFEQITIEPPVNVVEWCGPAGKGHLRLLDQTLLPNETAYVDCRDRHTVRSAIRKLVVRGAPAIGVAAGYGMVVAAQNIQEGDDFLSRLAAVAEYLESARPTAVNLSWAVRRVEQRAITEADGGANDGQIITAMLDEARAIHTEDVEMCMSIGRAAAPLVMEHSGLLTHCNAGALATSGIGTATAGMYVAHAAGHKFTVYCDETRPLLQGSRLTAWELQQADIDAVVITDNMTAHTMKEGRVGMVIVGADRIAANGDAANKIGTYGVAILANCHGIPFYVAAPYSTFDMSLKSGDAIPIEERGAEEITHGFGNRTAPEGIATYCPAFDVTPAELITGIITDRGIISPVTPANVKKVLG
ncbi:MAG: S-methyl-5-thioribose-1-phosphate isomerase [Phycisphaerae bacterium]|nr:S-methyl-5-thioribose-1-phosphate isomerase [Phycisphaerae bacterium]